MAAVIPERILLRCRLAAPCSTIVCAGLVKKRAPADTPRMTPGSWLFTRASRSIRLVRAGQGIIVLNVYGPDNRREVYAFDDELGFRSFVNRLERQLLESGWKFEGLDFERRRGDDRRRRPRRTPERRRPAQMPSPPR